jgi:cbb3-type cytochrome oxidase maturation protein
MNVLVYLVPMALLLGLTGLAAFLWSLRSGQYDDLEGAAVRVLDDDDIRHAGPEAPEPPVLREVQPLSRRHRFGKNASV